MQIKSDPLIEPRIFYNLRQAKFGFEEYIKKNINLICRYSWNHRFIELRSGLKICFMTDEEYVIWCKGKTYLLDGKFYHSGVPMIGEIENAVY